MSHTRRDFFRCFTIPVIATLPAPAMALIDSAQRPAPLAPVAAYLDGHVFLDTTGTGWRCAFAQQPGAGLSVPDADLLDWAQPYL